MSSQIRASLTLAKFISVLWIRRVPISLLTAITAPLTILFFIYVYGGVNYLAYGLIGTLISLSVSAGLGVGPLAITYRVEYKFEKLIVSSPVTPFAYVLGLALGNLTYSIVGYVLICLVFLIEGMGIPTLLELLLTASTIWGSMVITGFMISSVLPESRTAFQITGVLSAVLTIFPPVLYPSTLLPPSIRFIVYIIPTSNAANLIQGLLGLQQGVSYGFFANLVFLALFDAIAFLLALKWSRWREV